MAHRYSTMEEMLTDVLSDLSILSGDTLGPKNASWQDIAGTAICNLNLLAKKIESYRKGMNFGSDYFPSPSELIEKLDNQTED